MKSDVVITGASGFVGSNISTHLAKKYCLHKVSRYIGGDNDYTWGQLDSLPIKSRAFIHLAGKAHDLRGESQKQEYIDVNVGLTKCAFEAFKSSESEVFIYFSSVKAVASQVPGVLTENDELDVDTPYGQSKREAEKYLLSQELESNQRLYILRPCMIHGPENKGNLNLLFQMAKRSVPFPFGAYVNERSLLGIDNLKLIIEALISQKPLSDVYNLADDEYVSTSGIYSQMGEVLGKSLYIWAVWPWVINGIGKIGDVLPLPIDSLKIMKLTENYRVSNSKIKLALGWSKMPFSLIDNLTKTIKSFA